MGGGTAALAATRLLIVCLLLAGLAVGHVLPGIPPCLPIGAAPVPPLAPAALTVPIAPTSRTAPAAPTTLARTAIVAPTDPAATTGLISAVGRAGLVGAAIVGAPQDDGAGGHHRVTCAATRPPPGLGALLALLALGLTVPCVRTTATNRGPAGHGTRRRGPPRAGAFLLRDVCVCQT
ncbi:hypothetical protein [Frankia sp. QA3]|uniref:hypothetical protein n=1 Tax=Frankia sp. QA3 TaxID=710111 RepID=UPI000269C165|nr:hypothetical protein [Frankia sp. QA3]EIV92065.1 hypothetical protein FraQA3DRAFT_1563 [Frankia sp. QA3]